MSFGVAELARLLWLSPREGSGFLGYSPAGGTPRVYGGQMVAQALVAAGRTVGDRRPLHAIHGDFLGPARIDRPIEFEVELLKQGASFTLAAVSASQGGRVAFRASVSFHAAEADPGGLRRIELGEGPDGMPSEAEFLRGAAAGPTNGAYDPRFFSGLIERRSMTWAHPTRPQPTAPRNAFWCRVLGDLADAPPLLHQAMLAYVSDLSLVQTAFRPRGAGAMHPDTRTATLSHAMWFHAPLRADRWFHYGIEGHGYTSNRGLARGEIAAADGTLAVTVMQEGLQRIVPGVLAERDPGPAGTTANLPA